FFERDLFRRSAALRHLVRDPLGHLWRQQRVLDRHGQKRAAVFPRAAAHGLVVVPASGAGEGEGTSAIGSAAFFSAGGESLSSCRSMALIDGRSAMSLPI